MNLNSNKKGSIIIAGALAQRPYQAGHTWQFLHYLLGFKRLGWDVLFLDALSPEMCVDKNGQITSLENSINLRYLNDIMHHFGLKDAFSLIYDGGSQWLGQTETAVLAQVKQAPFLLNVMGYLKQESVLAQAQQRVFLDTDPGFGQMWCALGMADIFTGHDTFITIGEHIGQPQCTIPTCQIKWLTMRQPIVLDQWPMKKTGQDVTSIGSWRGPYAPIEYNGRTYGLRVHEFRQFVPLPYTTSASFKIALDIHQAEVNDLALLAQNNWMLIDPAEVASHPIRYRQFIQDSQAEFMVAKGIYVHTHSGWFSERSMCYLASGKPVLAQDTGLADLYPVGEGLLTFQNLAEAETAVAELFARYERHAQAARDLAEAYFDSDIVLSNLLAKLGCG